MGSASTDKLEALLKVSPSSSQPELKTTLTRRSFEMRERLAKGSPSSLDFLLSDEHAGRAEKAPKKT